MKNKSWNELYKNDILRNGGYQTYYDKKIKYRSKFIKKIMKYAENKKVLEAGCGTGVIPIYLSLHNFSSYAVDYNQEMLNLVSTIALSVGSTIPNLIKEDIFQLHKRFEKNEIDVTYSIGVYEHYDDKNIKKLLKSQLKISKYVFIGVPTKYFNDNEKLYGNERFLEIKYWRQLLFSANCEIVEEFSCYNDNLLRRIKKYKKWFKPAPIYVFVVKKL